MTDRDWKYGIQSLYDQDYCVVPPSHTLTCPWRGNHSIDPTHELVWKDDDVPYLSPLKEIDVGVEFTFNYWTHKSYRNS